MQFLKPAVTILSRFKKDHQQNLKLLISRQLTEQSVRLLPNTDRQALTRLVYGVIRQEPRLHFIIQQVSKRKIKKIQAPVLLLLDIATYLLFFSDSYPSYAVVNEVVNCAGKKTRSFINALLRNMVRQEKEIRAALAQTPDPEIKYAMSPFLIRQLQLISNDLEGDLQYLNREPVFHLRVNHRVHTYNAALELLIAKEISYNEMPSFDSFEIKEAGLVVQQLLHGGGFYFQNSASQLIAIIASRFAGSHVLDCCAAPGSKSITLALLNPQLSIVANDIHPGRAKMIANSASSMQLDNIVTSVSDIESYSFQGDFDFIMVDAPCTSAGTVRKNPDLKVKIDAQQVTRNADAQERIMSTLLQHSLTGKPYILYSVCSFIKEETETIITNALASPTGAKFETVDISDILTEFGFQFHKGKQGFYLLPDEKLNNDIFFLCLLKPAP
jgi:16S rRNA (cytosine967-C5)-methyltransferase